MQVRIPKLVLARIYSMYQQGYRITVISDVTGYSYHIVEYRIKKAQVKRNKILLKVPRKVGKYDHLFNESVAEGRMYKEYLKK